MGPISSKVQLSGVQEIGNLLVTTSRMSFFCAAGAFLLCRNPQVAAVASAVGVVAATCIREAGNALGINEDILHFAALASYGIFGTLAGKMIDKQFRVTTHLTNLFIGGVTAGNLVPIFQINIDKPGPFY